MIHGLNKLDLVMTEKIFADHLNTEQNINHKFLWMCSINNIVENIAFGAMEIIVH